MALRSRSTQTRKHSPRDILRVCRKGGVDYESSSAEDGMTGANSAVRRLGAALLGVMAPWMAAASGSEERLRNGLLTLRRGSTGR
jgi:hypothetical protein